MEEEMDGLTNLKANLEILVEAVEMLYTNLVQFQFQCCKLIKYSISNWLSEISRCIRTRYLTLLLQKLR
jgi:hypothetical protein